MNLRQLINSKEALERLLAGSLPINVAWPIKTFVKSLNPEFASYDELKTQKIIELGAPVLKDGKPTGDTKVKDENLALFQEYMNELLDKDVEIKIPVINIQDLLDYKDHNGKGISITTADLFALDWLLVEAPVLKSV